jgi:hypothetical protein
VSRSYRKPIWVEGGPDKKRRKRRANKAVRKAVVVPKRAGFKKISNSWDITDWKFEDKKNPKASRK